MMYVTHRVNTAAELAEVPVECGVEIDIRDFGEDLVLQHDPYKGGERFEDWLKRYRHALIILNCKSERVELRVLELLKKYSITSYFFLDSTFPMIVQLAKTGETNQALRFSEFEGLDTIVNMAGKVKWVWVDCFTRLPIKNRDFQLLKSNGFNICLVSPELQGRPEDIEPYADYLKKEGIVFDAICTKLYNIPRWREALAE
jgi:hypothetical protein